MVQEYTGNDNNKGAHETQHYTQYAYCMSLPPIYIPQ